MSEESKCPMDGGKVSGHAVLFGMTNRLWWPHQLDLSILHQNDVYGRVHHFGVQEGQNTACHIPL